MAVVWFSITEFVTQQMVKVKRYCFLDSPVFFLSSFERAQLHFNTFSTYRYNIKETHIIDTYLILQFRIVNIQFLGATAYQRYDSSTKKKESISFFCDLQLFIAQVVHLDIFSALSSIAYCKAVQSTSEYFSCLQFSRQHPLNAENFVQKLQIYIAQWHYHSL